VFEIDQRKRALDGFFDRAKKVEDDEIKSDLAKLGAVLSCGFVERSVELVVMGKLDRRANDRIRSFVRSHFKRGTNYDCTAICSLLERFDPKWSKKMKKWTEDNPGPVESLVSVYGLRNSIAHGGGQTSSLIRITNYADDCKLVVDAMIQATR
jgi:hypothetical protein